MTWNAMCKRVTRQQEAERAERQAAIDVLAEVPTVAAILFPPETEEESGNRAIAAMAAHLAQPAEYVQTYATTGETTTNTRRDEAGDDED